MVNVSVSSLGYAGVAGYLLFRKDTALFATGTAGATFVHGGNSPQERVIPVLTITRQRTEQAGNAEYAVEVEAQRDILGLHCARVRIGFAKGTTTSLGFAATSAIAVALRVPDRSDINVVYKDKRGPGELKLGRLELPVSETWTELFFGLEGPSDERVRVEVYHPDKLERVRSAAPDQWYSVSGTSVPVRSQDAKTPTVPPPAPAGWAMTIEDEGIRRVFVHIEKHGAITEPEVTHMLGSPRAFRRFSARLEDHLPKLPFIVRIEMADGGKRYVKEGER